MLRMELFSSVMIRAIILSIGYFSALHIAYKIKPSKRSLIDAVLIVGLMVLMSTRVEWVLLKTISYYVLGYLLLTLNHHKDKYGSSMFSLILFMMISVSDLISLNILASSELLLNAVKYQEENIYGVLSAVIPSVVGMVMYIVSALFVQKTLDFTVVRSKVTYSLFSLFYLFLIVQISLVITHIIVYISPTIALEDVYQFIGYTYIPMIIIGAFSFYYLHHILKWEKVIKAREEELLTAEHKRRDGYRANHNVDNIILTIHTLTKNNQHDELKAYLDKL